MHSEVVGKYLEQILKFKASKELNDEYRDEGQREKLLKELTLELGFEESIWEERKKQADFNYMVFEELNDDGEFRSNLPKSWRQLTTEHLLKAIALDPYNEKYLNKYVNENYNYWKAEKSYAARFIELFPLSSTDSTNHQVEHEISHSELSYDYFRPEIIEPYIEQLIFLRDTVIVESVSKSDVAQIEKLDKAAGIDHQTKKQLEKEVEQMLEQVSDSMNTSWLDWKELHKTYLAAEKLVDLAPYDPEVLYSCIKFYGSMHWKIVSNYEEVKSEIEHRKVFLRSIHKVEKPRQADLLRISEESLAKARMLHNRFASLPEDLVKPIEEDEFLVRIRDLRNFYLNDSEIHPDYTAAFIEAQTISMYAHFHFLSLKRKQTRVGLGAGIILYLSASIFCIVVLGSIHFLWTFVVVPALLALGIGHLWMNNRTGRDRSDSIREKYLDLN